MSKITVIRKKLWSAKDRSVPPIGSRELLCNWVRDTDDDLLHPSPMVEMKRYAELLSVLPDRIVENLERSRLSRDGKIAMVKAGLGYEELLSAVIVDGAAIASSSTEAFLFPALLIPQNYLQPGGIPGRTLSWSARGRHTTLTTAATLTFKVGAALTNVIPTTTWCVSGPITMDVTIQTATMWRCNGEIVVRSVGSGGTVFAQGDSRSSAQALTLANETANYMGSAGSATPATAAVDMTVPQYFSLTGKWSLATAYSIQGHQFLVEALN